MNPAGQKEEQEGEPGGILSFMASLYFYLQDLILKKQTNKQKTTVTL